MGFAGGSSGMLSADMVHGLVRENHIFGAFSLPSSPFLPVTATDEIYRISGTAVPLAGERVRQLLRRISAARIPLGSPLETGCTYVVRLRETLVLPLQVRGTFFSPSFRGHAALLADGVAFADTIPAGYLGELWAIVSPHVGPHFLSLETSLGSLAFFSGSPELPLGELLAHHHEQPLFSDRHSTALFPLVQDDQLFFTLHATEMQLARAGSFFELQTEEYLRLPHNWTARVCFTHQTLFLPPGFGSDSPHGKPLSLSFIFSRDTFLSPGQPLCSLEILPLAKPFSPPETLYTPPPEEILKSG